MYTTLHTSSRFQLQEGRRCRSLIGSRTCLRVFEFPKACFISEPYSDLSYKNSDLYYSIKLQWKTCFTSDTRWNWKWFLTSSRTSRCSWPIIGKWSRSTSTPRTIRSPMPTRNLTTKSRLAWRTWRKSWHSWPKRRSSPSMNSMTSTTLTIGSTWFWGQENYWPTFSRLKLSRKKVVKKTGKVPWLLQLDKKVLKRKMGLPLFIRKVLRSRSL